MSKSPCKVTVNMSTVPDPPTEGPNQLMPRSHWDVQIKPFYKLKAVPRGESAVVLVKSSPFVSCTVAAVPAAPVRDLSANIGSLLSAVGGIGAPSIAGPEINYLSPSPQENLKSLEKLNVSDPLKELLRKYADGRIPTVQLLDGIDLLLANGSVTLLDALNALDAGIKSAISRSDAVPQDIGLKYEALRKAVIRHWKFTFANDTDAQRAIADLTTQIDLTNGAFDSFTNLSEDVSLFDDAVTRFGKIPPPDDLKPQLSVVQRDIARLKSHVDLQKARLADYSDKRKLMLQVKDFLVTLTDKSRYPVYTTKALPMAYFSGKSATETITCKDAITKDQAFDNVIFTAYYEPVPHLDISVGAIGSMLGGRQTATLTGPFTASQAATCAANSSTGSAPCGPPVVLGYSSVSSYQFMPGVFGEWRFKNARCPWAENGAPWHPAGYICSFGLAGGIAINPNNGGPAAEFFEGVSFGIQRFALMIGAHNGRYQQFGGGYYLGEVFPPGTAVTPPTDTRWATRPAFAIAYRIPLR